MDAPLAIGDGGDVSHFSFHHDNDPEEAWTFFQVDLVLDSQSRSGLAGIGDFRPSFGSRAAAFNKGVFSPKRGDETDDEATTRNLRSNDRAARIVVVDDVNPLDWFVRRTREPESQRQRVRLTRPGPAKGKTQFGRVHPGMRSQ